MKNIILLLVSFSLIACVSTPEYDSSCTSRSGKPMTTNKVKSVMQVEPRYPANADQPGFVKARFKVDKKGHPKNIEIFESEPAGMYEDAAIKALKQWRYSPICEKGYYLASEEAQKTEVLLRFDNFPISADTVNTAMRYLRKHTHKAKRKEIDMVKSLEALAQIDQFMLERPNLNHESLRILRKARGLALIAINHKRNGVHQGEVDGDVTDIGEVSKSEIKLAIDDLEFVMQEAPDKYLYRSMYSAALFLLEDTLLGSRYLEYCAEMKHAACMNILAYKNFYGQDDTVINPKKAIYLHTETYKTGTEWGCAGYYSSGSLAETAYFSPYKTGDTWQNWLAKADAFFPKLQERFEKELPCTSADDELLKYLMYLGEGQPKPELLDNAMALEPEPWEIDFVNALKANKAAEQPIEYFYQTKPDSKQCHLGFLLMIFAYSSGNDELINIQQGNFAKLDKNECADEYLLLSLANMLPAGS
ncbi:energy transducer TonB [Catenovulum sp. SX2]|uniref:energy transducer TonB n=1 Tax=Catenovulum sp. SX2 TaxID=3398614 RepID=UPI003F87DDCF